MKKLLYILIAWLATAGCKDKILIDDLIIINEIAYYDSIPFNGIAIDYVNWFKEQIILGEFTFQNGEKNGLAKRWNRNGKLIDEDNYKNGKLHGLCKTFHENGEIYLEYNYLNNKKHGLAKNWYEDGQLMFEGAYYEGELNGLCKWWYEDGQLKDEDNYKNGVRDGPSKSWHENGELSFSGQYKNGRKNSFCTYWHKNGQHQMVAQYKDDIVVSFTYWNEYGELTNKKDRKGMFIMQINKFGETEEETEKLLKCLEDSLMTQYEFDERLKPIKKTITELKSYFEATFSDFPFEEGSFDSIIITRMDNILNL